MTSSHSRPYPLGATLTENGCNFAVHAPNCNEIHLALFNDNGDFVLHDLANDSAGIRHTFIPAIKAGQKYNFIIREQEQTLMLSDPYAKSIDEELTYEPPFDASKSFNLAKCVVVDDHFDWQNTTHPRIPREEMVLFEAHVKGVTQQHPLINANRRGRYLGLASPEMLSFYKQQNINTLQLLPIAACMHEPHLLAMNKVNYWGYNPYLFMAPDPRYAQYDAVDELKTTIRELHKHGIEVILDVVYNHTAEGGNGPTTFNLKALDPHYYLKHGEHFANFTGCGNTVDLSYQPALNLVMDTLRYWVTEFKVDGFRFDLAATLGRQGEEFNQKAAFFAAVAQDPVLKETKLIAEPWDIGPDGYQVGNFPFGWNECNDKLRDITRSFWRGDQGYLKEFATRLMGSRDIYSAANWPHKLTVNYITYHDGFTLQDLVSYQHKHNDANGENNRDGHGDNRSCNYGIEGPTTDISITSTREKQKRNLIASLLFAFGIPHVLLADVLSHSQGGNNNAYCQDNKTSWLDWGISKDKQAFRLWLAEMVAQRQRYMVPFIRAFSGKNRNKNRIFWRCLDGTLMRHEDWNRVNSVSLHLGAGKDGQEMVYLINQSKTPVNFSLPIDRKQKWQILCDTAQSSIGLTYVEEEVRVAPASMIILYYQE
ncbi:glycogen debranching enzyme GlgX [Vibrio azureus]|uniref:Glycogen debranching enzyme n=1 Tax=Vibrio azureus NBRC 104587 TaxID=1219077 RepID=U3A3J3_9VIBR|nr:glycogen debranching protein GlgX [Vibrio azureus]AUI87606.1 glycogen debranching enzyme GlgX [Vibrio azureus]GAD74581.1 glycogen debranching enzyme [Vibrio azureus NBRC 104587]